MAYILLLAMSDKKQQGPKAGTPNAKRGGEAVRAKYGTEFYSQIGKRGGDAVKEQLGQEHYARIGRMGGLKTLETHGAQHFKDAGRKGGQAGAGTRKPRR